MTQYMTIFKINLGIVWKSGTESYPISTSLLLKLNEWIKMSELRSGSSDQRIRGAFCSWRKHILNWVPFWFIKATYSSTVEVILYNTTPATYACRKRHMIFSILLGLNIFNEYYYDISNAVREVNNLLNTDVFRHIATSAYYFIDCQRMVYI